MSFSGVPDACKLAYLAGIMDGEGSFIITKKGPENFTILISVAMVEMTVPNLFRQLFGGNVYVDAPKARCRPVYRWQTRKFSDAKYVIESLLPYLLIKKRQAYNLLEFVEGVEDMTSRKTTPKELERRKDLYLKNKKLNLVGKNHPDSFIKEKYV